MLLVLNAYIIYILHRFWCIRCMIKCVLSDFEFCTIEDDFWMKFFNFRAMICYCVLQGWTKKGKKVYKLILCSWVRALWIGDNNCPTRCDYIQCLFPANCSACFGWYLHPSSGACINCNYSIWHWWNRITTFRCCEGVWLHDSRR